MSPNRLWDSPGRPVLIDAPQCWPSRTAAGASPKSSGALPHRLRRRTVRKADGTGRARPTEACRLMPAHAARRSPIRSARNRRLLRQPPGHSPRAGHPRPLDRGHPFGTACAARRVPIPERLAVLTGRGVHAFAGALPELREPATGLGDVSATRRRPAATSAMPVTAVAVWSGSCRTTLTSVCGTTPGSARPTSTSRPSISLSFRRSSTPSAGTCASCSVTAGSDLRRGAERPHDLRAHLGRRTSAGRDVPLLGLGS